MIKAIFWILIFFFLISVLFYGIRFILLGIASAFQHETKKHKYPVHPKSSNPEATISALQANHQLNYYDPIVDEQIIEKGNILKCYAEHGTIWIKFKPLNSDTIKTIKSEHISKLDNLQTNEAKQSQQEVIRYLNRFL